MIQVALFEATTIGKLQIKINDWYKRNTGKISHVNTTYSTISVPTLGIKHFVLITYSNL